MKKFWKENKGITIVALVVTIIVLILLAGISISTLYGDNGVITVSKNQKRQQEINIITQSLKTRKIDIALLSEKGNVLVDNYIAQVENSEKMQHKVTKVEKIDEDIAYITLDDDYVYLLEEKKNGDLEITYEGEITNVTPRIRNVEVIPSNDKIEVKVTALRTDKYKFYIKAKDDSEYIQMEENTTGEYIFTGLTKDKEYLIKIEAINAKGQDKEVLSVITADIPIITAEEVKFIKSDKNWTNKNVITEVEINTKKNTEGCELQYAKFDIGAELTEEELKAGQWVTYTDDKIVSEKNEVIYIRLSKGNNTSSYISTAIRNIDKVKPQISTNLAASNVTTKGFTLDIEILDELSGLGKIDWNYRLISNTQYTSAEEIYTTLNGTTTGEINKVNKTKEITDLTNGTYNVYAVVYDVAGNSVTSETIEVVLKTIEKAEGATKEPTEWTSGDVTITLPTKDGLTTEYQIGELVQNVTWDDYNDKFTVSSNTTVYYRYSDGKNVGEHNYIEITNIDKENPEATSVEIKNITTTGYDVYVYGVADSKSGVNRVEISTWTEANGQDDVKTETGTDQGEGTWYYRVNVTDHNSEVGKYNTKVYVYDNVENKLELDVKTANIEGVTITFDHNDGTENKTTVTKGYNLELGTLPTVEKVGYILAGWHTAKENGTQITEKTKVPAANTTYYAVWTPNTNTPYKVVHEQMKLDGTTYEIVETENLTGTTDTKVTPAVKTYEGFTAPEAQEVTIAPDGSTIVTYKYTRNKYWIDLNGYLDTKIVGNLSGYGTVDVYINGTLAVKDTVDCCTQLYYGSTYEIKNIRATTGHTYNGVHSGSLTGTITKNATVVLNFTTDKYTITYDANLPKNYMTPNSDTISFSDFTGAQNTTFRLGILYVDGLQVGDTIKISMDIAYENITVDSTKNYRIVAQGAGNITSWNPGIGFTDTNKIVGTGKLHYEDTISLSEKVLTNDYLAMQIRTDYITGGTLTFSNIKVTKESSSSVELAYGSELGTLPTVAEAGYTFKGWYTAPTGGTKIETTTTVGESNVTYYGQWIANSGIAYKVVHEQMGIDGTTYEAVETENKTGTTGEIVAPAVKSYPGFTAPAVQRVTISGDGSTTVTYRYTRNQYTFTLGSATGVSTTGSSETKKYYYGATITLKATVDTGYRWSEWVSTTSLVANNTAANTTITMPADDLKMIPTVTENTYTIAFDANGGTGTMKSIAGVRYTESKVLTTNTFTRAGYTFAGWNTKADGSGTNYNDGATVSKLSSTKGATVTLYAKWTVNTYTAEFRSNLIYNGQFTNGLSGWTTHGNGQIAVDTTVKNGTQNSVRVSTTASGYEGIRTLNNVTYKPNTKYKITFKAYRDSSSTYGNVTRPFRVYLPEIKSDGTLLDYRHYITIDESNLPDKTWKEFTTTFTTSASGAGFESLIGDFNEESGKGNIWLADIKVEEIQTISKAYGNELGTLPSVTRTGYTFGGWFTGENGTGTQIASTTTMGASDVTYYAQWTDNIAPTAPTTMSYVFGDWSPYTNDTWTNREVYAARQESNPGPTGATDSGSGIAKYQISKDNSTWYDYNYNCLDSMYCMSTEGTHIRYFRAVDNEGNVSPSISRVAKIDQTMPTIKVYVDNVEIVGTVDAEGTSWRGYLLGNYNKNKTVKVVANDTGGAGVKQLEIANQLPSLQFENATIAGNQYTYTVKEEGEYCFHIKVTDNAGNTTKGISTEDDWIRKRIKIDKTAPTITLTADKTGWTNQNVIVTPTYSDNMGIASKTLTCTGTNGQEYGEMYIYDGKTSTLSSINVMRNGQTVTASATDLACNTTIETLTINNIDILEPGATTVTYNSGSGDCSWKNNYSITLSATDAAAIDGFSGMSGIQMYEMDWDNDNESNYLISADKSFEPWDGFDSHNVRFRAVDYAGNRGPWSEAHHIHMDTTLPAAPSVPDLIDGHDTGSSNTDNITKWWYQVNVKGTAEPGMTIHLRISNISSDIRAVGTVDSNGNWEIPIDLYQNQWNHIYAWSVDAAGNYAQQTSYLAVYSDTTAPTVPTITYNGGSNTCSWKNNYNLTLSSSDATGIWKYQVDHYLDETVDREIGSNFVPDNGYSTCTDRYRAVDTAGNEGAWTEQQHIHMDTQSPTHTSWWWGEVTKDVARLYIQTTDNIGISRVQGPTSTETGGYNNWVWFEAVWDEGANAYRCDITPATFGHYGQTYITHLYIYDHAGNGGYYNQTSVAIPVAHSHTTSCYHTHNDSCYNWHDLGYCNCGGHDANVLQGDGHCRWAEGAGYSVSWVRQKGSLKCTLSTTEPVCGY